MQQGQKTNERSEILASDNESQRQRGSKQSVESHTIILSHEYLLILLHFKIHIIKQSISIFKSQILLLLLFLPCGAFRHSLTLNSLLVVSENTTTETPNNNKSRGFQMFLFLIHVLSNLCVNLLCKLLAKSWLNQEQEASNRANEQPISPQKLLFQSLTGPV